MPIIFRITEEIRNNMNMNLSDANFGIFLIKLNLLNWLVAEWKWIAKSVMGGWSKDIILRSTVIQKEASH